jgi:hypothetical protein
MIIILLGAIAGYVVLAMFLACTGGYNYGGGDQYVAPQRQWPDSEPARGESVIIDGVDYYRRYRDGALIPLPNCEDFK